MLLSILPKRGHPIFASLALAPASSSALFLHSILPITSDFLSKKGLAEEA